MMCMSGCGRSVKKSWDVMFTKPGTIPVSIAALHAGSRIALHSDDGGREGLAGMGVSEQKPHSSCCGGAVAFRDAAVPA